MLIAHLGFQISSGNGCTVHVLDDRFVDDSDALELSRAEACNKQIRYVEVTGLMNNDHLSDALELGEGTAVVERFAGQVLPSQALVFGCPTVFARLESSTLALTTKTLSTAFAEPGEVPLVVGDVVCQWVSGGGLVSILLRGLVYCHWRTLRLHTGLCVCWLVFCKKCRVVRIE